MANTYLYLMFFVASSISLCKASFCSEDDKIVNCVPCTTISNLKRFHCPQECNNHAQSLCTEVCNKFCLNNQCKFVKGSLECSQGCIDGLTGKYCQEACPGNCARCDQFTGKCVCEGEHCTEKPKTKLKSIPSAKVSLKTSTLQTPKKHKTLEKTRLYLKTTSAVPLEPEKSTVTRVQSDTSTSQNSGLRFLLAGIVLTVVVACTITTISLILVWRKRRKERRLNV